MSDTTADIPVTSDAPKIGDAWGDDISEERQRELDAFLAAWDAEVDHGERMGPFALKGWHAALSGADLFYLAAKALVGTIDLMEEPIDDLAVAKTTLRNDVPFGLLNLSALHLAGTNFVIFAKLANAYLVRVQLSECTLVAARLENANLALARLTNSNLTGAWLEGSDLSGAHLEDVSLQEAKLAAANLTNARLERTNLRFARLDRDTKLNGARLAGVSLDQIILDNVNLTVVSWEGVAPLGDELRARAPIDKSGKPKSEGQRIADYEAAARANRLLATALRAQGLTEDADVLAYHAQLMQRGLRFQRRQFGRWLISWGLAAMAGYGYRLWRIFFAYGLVLAVFALIFWALGVHSYGAEPWYQALWDSFLVSLSAIHGRAVFEQLGAWTPAAWVAAIESVVGIVIEGVFVAMLIQRLFR